MESLINISAALDSVQIDWRKHLALSLGFGGLPLTLPPTLQAALENATDLNDIVEDFEVLFKLMTANVHNHGYDYAVKTVYLNCDNLSVHSARLDIFYRTTGYHAGDPYYTTDSFVIVNLREVYRLGDNNTVAGCGLTDTTIGYWLRPLTGDDGDGMLDDINERTSNNYSSEPLYHLEQLLKAPPVWSDRRQCYLGRPKGIPFVCRIEPYGPVYN
jgi:hypothetical protein